MQPHRPFLQLIYDSARRVQADEEVQIACVVQLGYTLTRLLQFNHADAMRMVPGSQKYSAYCNMTIGM